MTRTSRLAIAWVLALSVGCTAPTANRASSMSAPLVIQEQGSFAVGGTIDRVLERLRAAINWGIAQTPRCSPGLRSTGSPSA